MILLSIWLGWGLPWGVVSIIDQSSWVDNVVCGFSVNLFQSWSMWCRKVMPLSVVTLYDRGPLILVTLTSIYVDPWQFFAINRSSSLNFPGFLPEMNFSYFFSTSSDISGCSASKQVDIFLPIRNWDEESPEVVWGVTLYWSKNLDKHTSIGPSI